MKYPEPKPDGSAAAIDTELVEVLVQLDAHAAGNFLRFEFDLGDGGERLCDRIERRGDVVMIGEERGRARRLRERW